MQLTARARDFVSAIDWASAVIKCLEMAGWLLAAIFFAVVSFAEWLIKTAATAAVWFAVWAVGCFIAFLGFVRLSGFKFTRLMELLS